MCKLKTKPKNTAYVKIIHRKYTSKQSQCLKIIVVLVTPFVTHRSLYPKLHFISSNIRVQRRIRKNSCLSGKHQTKLLNIVKHRKKCRPFYLV